MRNEADAPVAFHWHGLRLDGLETAGAWMDGVPGVTQCPLVPGSEATYEFQIKDPAGTYFYHGHAALQDAEGLLGPIIVHDREESASVYSSDRVFIVQDTYYASPDMTALLSEHKLPSTSSRYAEPIPDGALINGANTRRNCTFMRGYGVDCDESGLGDACNATSNVQLSSDSLKETRHRLRVINAGVFATFHIQADEHTFDVVEVDGTAIEPFSSPVPTTNALMISPGQRYSIVLNVDAEDPPPPFWFRARMVTKEFKGPRKPTLNPDVQIAMRVSQASPPTPAQQPTCMGPCEPTSRSCFEFGPKACVHVEDSDLRPAYHSPGLREKKANALAKVRPDDFLQIKAHFATKSTASGTFIHRGFFNQSAAAYPMSSHPKSTFLGDLIKLYTHDGLFQSIFHDESGTIDVADWSSYLGASNAQKDLSAVSKYGLVYYTRSSGMVVDVLITNHDADDHPFYLQGHKFWILASGKGVQPPSPDDLYGDLVDLDSPTYRDTVPVQSAGWALLRVVLDKPGVWALHCTVGWHAEAGLMMLLVVAVDDVVRLAKASGIRDKC